MLTIHLNPPTLQLMALNTISFELWKQPDIVSEIKHLLDSHHGSCDADIYPDADLKKWFNIQERVVEKMFHLSLPELVKEKAKEAIELIGLRITLWLKNVIEFLPPDNISNYIHLISLNLDGGIDRKKTALSILKELPNMKLYNRYRFACFHCLEDEIRSLWEIMPDERKFIHLNIRICNMRGQDSADIVIYWSCFISQEFDSLYRIMEDNPQRSDNINDYFIRNSIEHSNCVSFKYFWEKLSEEEKQENIVKYALELTKARDIVCDDDLNELYGDMKNVVGDLVDIRNFLGYQMNEVQFKEMFKLKPFRPMHFLLSCAYWKNGLISWDYLWNCISPQDYVKFLNRFVLGMLCPSKFILFAKKERTIFRELWENTPNNIKRVIFEKAAKIEEMLHTFIITVDVENLHLIFDDATVEERKKIIHHTYSRKRFVSLLQYRILVSSSERLQEQKPLTELEINNFLDDIQSAFNRKHVKGDLRLLLNKLNKWKTRTTS